MPNTSEFHSLVLQSLADALGLVYTEPIDILSRSGAFAGIFEKPLSSGNIALIPVRIEDDALVLAFSDLDPTGYCSSLIAKLIRFSLHSPQLLDQIREVLQAEHTYLAHRLITVKPATPVEWISLDFNVNYRSYTRRVGISPPDATS